MVDGISSSATETTETNAVKLVFTVTPEKFEEGVKYSYNKNKASIQVQGFRKGKVPRVMVERLYGKQFFYSDAVDYVFEDVYVKVLHHHKLNPVQNPKIDVKEVSAENGVQFEVEMIVEPLVGISDYLGITYEPFDLAVTEDEISKAIDRDKEKNARVITIDDRPAQTGDTVVIDFNGTVDGEAFEGGEASDFELVLGSGSFIDNFEEQLTGLSTGGEADVGVTFPDEYAPMPALAGKAARFAVKLKEIRVKEYPELDDDFAQDVSEFETFDEYKADISKKIAENKERFAEGHKQEQIVKKLVEKIEGEIPQVMFEAMAERIYEEYKGSIKNRGLDYEMYLQYSGDSDERIRASAKDDADMRVRSRLALTAVAALENIAVSDEEAEEEITRIAESYGMKREQVGKTMDEIQMDRLKDDIKVQKALKLITDAAVADESSGAKEVPEDEALDESAGLDTEDGEEN